MARRLRMSAELDDWLAELCTFQPASAAEVGAAVVSVMTAGSLSALPIVGEPAAGSVDPREQADHLYQSLLEALQPVRRESAEAATDRKHWAIRVQEAEDAGRPDEVRAQLRRRLDDAERRERALTERSQRMQLEVDAFRTTKETAKAMYTAAEATVRIHDAMGAATGDRSVADDNDELAAHRRALAAAQVHLQAVAAQASQTLRKLQEERAPRAGQDERRPPPPPRPATGLLELRADPLGRDVRLLLAVEPADAVMLLAVLDGEDAVAEHRAQAIELAGDLLTDVRTGDWPPQDALRAADLEVTFADAATFLARFFPSDSGAIAERAATLAAAESLASLRGSNGMSLADLSVETGISEDRLRLIEAGGLRLAQVHEAVAYVRALGGRLTLTADLDESAAVTLA
jgi:phage shock protein A